MLLISVVITVKNEQRHMRDLLDSLVAQEGPIEVLIVDAHSDDQTIPIVRSYMKKYDFIKLHVYGGTRARSRNKGVKEAKGEALAFVDGDMIIAGDHVAGGASNDEEGAAFIFEKDDADWMIREPIECPANKRSVDSMVKTAHE